MRKITLNRLLPLFFATWMLLLSSWALAAQPVTIGVLAFRPSPQVLERWDALAKGLTEAYPQYQFRVITYGYPELEAAVAQREIDLILTNPGHYILLSRRIGLSMPLATLINMENGQPVSAFGGVIITRAERQDIRTIDDLRGRSIASVSTDSLGGYQTQAFELSVRGLQPDRDYTLQLTGMPHDNVIDAVLSGRTDAGFVRTGLIESLIRENRLRLEQLHIINQQPTENFPTLHSTQLYPEWPLAALLHTDDAIKRKVLTYLVNLIDDPHSRAAMNIEGFNPPSDYTPVETLLRELRMPPFDDLPPFTLTDIWEKHHKELMIILATIFAIITLLLIYLALANRRLRDEKQVVLHQTDLLRLNRDQLQLAAGVFTHASEGIMITDIDGHIVKVNDAFTRTTGYTQDEVKGRTPKILNSGQHTDAFFEDLWNSLFQKGYWHNEIRNRTKDGTLITELVTISAIRDEQKEIRNFVAIYSDITKMKDYQLKLERIAHYDPLTHLPNRVLLSDRLNQAILQCQRHFRHLAVAYIDLDGFTEINERLGHDFGDQLLRQVANHMLQVISKGDILARLGGDEFAVVLPELDDIHEATPTLNRLLKAVAQPVEIEGQRVQVSASMGVTYYPQDDEMEADQLLRQADQAMYNAKLAGKNCYHIFDPSHDRNVRGQNESLEEIARGLAQNEFVLFYQPKVNMRTGSIIGAEALIRWQHPSKGLLSPAAFLPLLENQPLSVDLGEWVLHTALQQHATWLEMGMKIPVSINISAYHLQKDNFTERLEAILTRFPSVDPTSIEIELLETAAFDDLISVTEVIRRCRKLGLSFALDDFGTGYCSLTYLRHLPVNTLKIDQTFVRDMLDDPDDFAIMAGVYELGTAFQRHIIAEGVETEQHGRMLLQLGCELAQGYGIARPMPAEQLPDWLSQWQPYASWKYMAPIRREALPLLYASVDLRHWLKAMDAYLRSESDQTPPLDETTCRFGAALQGYVERSDKPHTFHQVIQLHHQLHDQAHKACDALRLASEEELQESLRQISDLGNQLLVEIERRLL